MCVHLWIMDGPYNLVRNNSDKAIFSGAGQYTEKQRKAESKQSFATLTTFSCGLVKKLCVFKIDQKIS